MPKNTHKVILVHGIRTRAQWYAKIRHALEEEDIDVITPGYERFDLISFLLPGPTRERAVRHIERQIVSAFLGKTRNTNISIIAHSFGTHIVSEILERNPNIRPYKVIFCGSVASTKKNWAVITNHIEKQLINECGCRDAFPILAAALTIGFSPTGTYGIQRNGVLDRFHDLNHSGFFSEENAIAFTEWPNIIKDSNSLRSKTYVTKYNKSLFPKIFSFIEPIFVRLYIFIFALIISSYVFEEKFENLLQVCIWNCDSRKMSIQSNIDYSFSYCNENKIINKAVITDKIFFTKYVKQYDFSITTHINNKNFEEEITKQPIKSIYNLSENKKLEKTIRIEDSKKQSISTLNVYGRQALVGYMIHNADGLLQGVGIDGKFPIKDVKVNLLFPRGFVHRRISCTNSDNVAFKKFSKFDMCETTDSGFKCNPEIETNILVYCFEILNDNNCEKK